MKNFEIIAVHLNGTTSTLNVQDVSIFSCMRNSSKHLLPFSWMEGQITTIEVNELID